MLKSPFTRNISIIFLILTFLPNISFAQTSNFSDILDNNRYATAINYLAEAGIIQGYSDGTFKPYQNVNRAEFLKLVLEGSDISSDITTTSNFSDIDESAWYSKYVRKAKKEGWIEGYPDGTFRPSQNINKVEALKIIGEVQNWNVTNSVTEKPFIDTELTDWFTPYVAHAKSKNLLEETSQAYIPSTILSRARISEMMFRSFITIKSGENIYSTSLLKKYPASLYSKTPAEEPEPEFTSVNFTTYSKDFFNNIVLETETPNIFYKNEIYQFSGTINSGTYDQIFIFLTPEDVDSSQTEINFVAQVNNGKFKIPVYFTAAGNFQLGLIPGNSGESKIMDISVLSSLPTAENATPPSKPETPTISYQHDQTSFSWDSGTNELKRISFEQGSKNLTFYNRQNINSLIVEYPYFEYLSTGSTYLKIEKAKLAGLTPLTISSGWSTAAQSSFNAVTHEYGEVDDEGITYNSLPDTTTTNTTIKFSGTAKKDIESDASIITPDGNVTDVPLTTSTPLENYYGQTIIPQNAAYSFSYTPTTSGTYILELNGYDGSAVINIPVYVSTGIPIVPDFFDLNKYASPPDSLNLFSSRNELLSLINQTRNQYGLSTLKIDSDLNQLAQLHSEDMNDRDFFGHINPDGKTPEMRRTDMGITTTVGENLAIAPTIAYTHNGLMRSAIHRKNILDPDWTKIGIGIVQNNDGSLIVTEEFSLEEYTEVYLNSSEDEIKNAINDFRTSTGLSELTTQFSLQTIADEWSQQMVEQNFFDFTSPNGSSLSDLVAADVPTLNVQALILETTTVSNIVEELLQSNEVNSSSWKRFGIGLKTTTDGRLKVTVLFSN